MYLVHIYRHVAFIYRELNDNSFSPFIPFSTLNIYTTIYTEIFRDISLLAMMVIVVKYLFILHFFFFNGYDDRFGYLFKLLLLLCEWTAGCYTVEGISSYFFLCYFVYLDTRFN